MILYINLKPKRLRQNTVTVTLQIYAIPNFAFKNRHQGYRIDHRRKGRIETSSGSIIVEACQVMTSGDPQGRIFYPTLT